MSSSNWYSNSQKKYVSQVYVIEEPVTKIDSQE